jgi:hypothetical protein
MLPVVIFEAVQGTGHEETVIQRFTLRFVSIESFGVVGMLTANGRLESVSMVFEDISFSSVSRDGVTWPTKSGVETR